MAQAIKTKFKRVLSAAGDAVLPAILTLVIVTGVIAEHHESLSVEAVGVIIVASMLLFIGVCILSAKDDSQ